MAKKKKKTTKQQNPDRWVSKAVALRIIAELKLCTPAEFREALEKKQFEMGSPSRVNNILSRLKGAGLIGRTVEKEEMVPYNLPTRDGKVRKVSRMQDFVSWSITNRGKRKLDYYTGEGR